MMWGKKHISIEDVISEKQIKFSSNLQDEAAKKLWHPAQENTVLLPKTNSLWSLSNSKVSSCR
jgi:hypothetical protein